MRYLIIFAALTIAVFLPILAFGATCPNLTRNLSRGMSGDDVKQLQQFLISSNSLESGFDTGYFGAKTEAAVQKFQCERNLICSGSPATTGWGTVGPRTRAAITSACNGAPGQVTSVPLISSGGNRSCEFGGKTIPHRSAVTAYKNQSVPFGSYCEGEQRVCTNGTLSGTYANSFCVSSLPASCMQDGLILLDGQFQTYYSARSAQSPDLCSMRAQSRECLNGRLTGDSEFQYASCTDSAALATTTLAAPTGLYASCSADGTRVTLSWKSTPGASSYSIRVVPSGSSVFKIATDWYRGTTFSASVTPNTAYSWWIHANADDTTVGPYTIGSTFTCAGSGLSNPNPNQTISIDAANIYSPAPVLFGTQPRLYFGGWLNASQTHDNIYVADCPFGAGLCSSARMVIDSVVQGFEHLNDPSIVLHPAVGTTSAYYIMYMTGVPAGESGLTITSNKIYYSTSWANDGLVWSKPVLLMSGFWLPSATMKNGRVELFANSTTDGRIAKFDLGESGIAVGAPAYVATFDNPASVPPFYSNVDVVWRPTLNLYQIVAERALSTAPGAASVIDYLTSSDGTSWHLARPSIISAETGQFRVGTPAQWVDSAQWVYFGSTAQTNSMGFKIRFAEWIGSN